MAINETPVEAAERLKAAGPLDEHTLANFANVVAVFRNDDATANAVSIAEIDACWAAGSDFVIVVTALTEKHPLGPMTHHATFDPASGRGYLVCPLVDYTLALCYTRYFEFPKREKLTVIYERGVINGERVRMRDVLNQRNMRLAALRTGAPPKHFW